MNEAEHVVLVDDRNHEVGIAPKATVHTRVTPLHRGFSLFLFDSAGRLLLQRRALGKRTWPGVWSNSCCGHPASGESVTQAARRRAEFELGWRAIDPWVVVDDFRYRAELDGVVENEICPILVARVDGEPRPNPQEVEEVRWIAWDEFVAAIRREPAEWSPWCVLEVERLMADEGFLTWVAPSTHASAVDAPPALP